MKNKLITLALLFTCLTAKAQWSYETVDNGLDPSFRVAYTKTTDHKFLKMEKFPNGNILLLMYDGYICEETPTFDISFKVDTGWVKFSNTGLTSEDKKKIYLTADLCSMYEEPFKKATVVRIRIWDTVCGTEITEFNMANSSAALNFIKQ